MHGLGNDYIYIECLKECPADLASLSREMSDRHRAVGGDGIILIMPSSEADFKMRIFNADGSEARMCGNGARCVGKYVYDNHLTSNHHVTLETLSGVKHLYLKPGADGMIEQVTVDMGKPSFNCDTVPVALDAATMIGHELTLNDGTTACLTAVSMGNPHGVWFLPTLEQLPIEKWGPELENHPLFPDRANIEFATVQSPVVIKMRVWERGSGETMACGTGACATFAAANRLGLVGNTATLRLNGGDLEISLDPETGHVMMTGPAETAFTGIYKRKCHSQEVNPENNVKNQ